MSTVAPATPSAGAAVLLARLLARPGGMDVKNSAGGHRVEPFPLMRRLVVDAARLGSRAHMIHGLLEVDVTHARRLIREHKAVTGQSLSFTAFLLACLGRAVEEHKAVHAMQDWRGRLVIFDEVDVNTLIEVEIDGHAFPLAHVIRAVNARPLHDLHAEIRRVQSQPGKRAIAGPQRRLMPLFLRLPAFARSFFYWLVSRNPHWLKRAIGTAALTAVGMFGQGGGWGIAIAGLYNLHLTVGGIAQKPGVVNGRIEIREYLSLTLSFNHDVIDGAPAARFAQRLKELIESAYGLGADIT